MALQMDVVAKQFRSLNLPSRTPGHGGGIPHNDSGLRQAIAVAATATHRATLQVPDSKNNLQAPKFAFGHGGPIPKT